MSDLKGIIERAESRAAKAKEKLAHKERMKQDRHYRKAMRVADVLERLGEDEGFGAVIEGRAAGLAADLRAAVQTGGSK